MPRRTIYAVWELTLRCDLGCGHCGSRAGKARSDELTTAEALDAARQMAALGVKEATLIGGEAYLREDWDQIARELVAHGVTVSMTTGGRGFTPERARRAKAAGVSSVSISLDGLEATHDLQRGVKGSFRAALESFDNLRAAGLHVSINTQINRLSYPELDPLLDLIAARGAFAWQVQLTVPMGRAADRPEWLIQPWEMLEVVPKVAELKRRGLGLGVRLWPGNNVGYFGPHEEELRREQAARGYAAGCTAGRLTLGLEADGALKGCPSLPTGAYTGGNLRERPLAELWEEAPELRFTRDKTVALWGRCASCYYADICRAGCTWTTHVLFGRPGNNPYCHHRALELQREGLRERVALAGAAPGLPFDHGLFELIEEPLHTPEPTGGAHAPRPLSVLSPAPARAGRALPVL